MASKHYSLVPALFLASSAMFATACGGGAFDQQPEAPSIEVGQSVRGATPSCGTNCSEYYCWVDFTNVNGVDVANYWLFNATQYSHSVLAGSKLVLSYPGTEFDGNLSDILPPETPSTLSGSWNLPSGFDVKASGLTAVTSLTASPWTRTCGFAVL